MKFSINYRREIMNNHKNNCKNIDINCYKKKSEPFSHFIKHYYKVYKCIIKKALNNYNNNNSPMF